MEKDDMTEGFSTAASFSSGTLTRVETEYCRRWIDENPGLFAQSITDFVDNSRDFGFTDVGMDIDRVGFITMFATCPGGDDV